MSNIVKQYHLLPLFKTFIVASKSGRRLTASKNKLSAGTIEQYKCVYKLLTEFELKHNTILRIVLLKKQSIVVLKKEKKYWSSFFKNFCQFLYKDKRHFDQYISSVCKVLRTFFNYLIKDKNLPVGNFHHLFRIVMPVYSPIVLEPFQLQFLLQDQGFEQSLPKHLKRTKDIFVFGCTVGLRYADLMKLKKDNIIIAPSGSFLQVYTQKTGTLVKLPLPSYLNPIIDNYKCKAGRFILPRISNVNFNLQIKEVIHRAGWTYALPKIRHRMGKPVELKTKEKNTLRFCDQISAHTMRRTAITTLLMLGVPEQAVRRISGHAPGSKEFYRYIALAEDYVHNHVRKAYEKLIENKEL